jgi:cystathionine gamma-synthase
MIINARLVFRLMLNPSSRFYRDWKQHVEATYEDIYFDNDALVMEVNSRAMEERVAVMNRNAEALSDMLYARSTASGKVKSSHII